MAFSMLSLLFNFCLQMDAGASGSSSRSGYYAYSSHLGPITGLFEFIDPAQYNTSSIEAQLPSGQAKVYGHAMSPYWGGWFEFVGILLLAGAPSPSSSQLPLMPPLKFIQPHTAIELLTEGNALVPGSVAPAEQSRWKSGKWRDLDGHKSGQLPRADGWSFLFEHDKRNFDRLFEMKFGKIADPPEFVVAPGPDHTDPTTTTVYGYVYDTLALAAASLVLAIIGVSIAIFLCVSFAKGKLSLPLVLSPREAKG
eukprot:GHVT01013908.1.p1 GENE.GHVT01013908.1~~GHVT01013908.1.p1  ORF type:complete len:253 (-),score=43.96 GHVT01013908.1:1046-1804(-)